MLHELRNSVLATSLALLTLLSGCAKAPTQPPVTNVELSLTVQPSVGEPSNPVSVELQAVNAGQTQIWHCEGCGCGNGTSLTVLDPSGSAVALTDPKALPPACPDGRAPLAPHGVLANGFRFTGVLYERDSPVFPSPTYAAPAGLYTVVAGFSYSKEQAGEWIPTSRVTTFTWKP